MKDRSGTARRSVAAAPSVPLAPEDLLDTGRHCFSVQRDIGDPDLIAEVLIGAVIAILSNIFVVLGLSLFVNRMTNKVVKARELSSKH
jgi:hypothetical protein